MKYKYILWDWNGTLLDDLETSLFAVNDMLELYGKKPITLEEYYSYIDTPIYKFYEHIFDLNVVTMEMIKPLFSRFYAENSDKLKLADGADYVLNKCREGGIKQYILSSAHIDNIAKYSQNLCDLTLFERVEGASDYDAGSKIERAISLFKNENINPDECVMIGDMLHDVETAEALGIDCILYAKGHTDYNTLAKTGMPVCNSFEEIYKNI